MKVRRMDLVVIQYLMVRVGSTDDNAWGLPVLHLNACSGVILLGIVGCACSVILMAGAVNQRNRGKDSAIGKPSALAPAYQGDNL